MDKAVTKLLHDRRTFADLRNKYPLLQRCDRAQHHLRTRNGNRAATTLLVCLAAGHADDDNDRVTGGSRLDSLRQLN